MSFDIRIGAWDGNYTFNSLGPLARAHLHPDGLSHLDGMTGEQASEALRHFWGSVSREVTARWRTEIVGEPDFCATYDSTNGWGSTVGALVFMGELTAACALQPLSRVEVGV
jgi:hypothetical protein